ncbi:MAG: hypothetical protein KKG76_04015 [Euryarchaeota archaeon]|nr:hypothetical protein [Euryarchaeota archaeon]
MILTPFKLHAIFGLILIIAGFAFDFLYLAPKVSESFKANPVQYLNSFERYMHDLIKTYAIAIGLVNIGLALLASNFAGPLKTDWAIAWLMIVSTIIFIAAGFWYANAGPAFEWELRCTVLTISFAGILLSIALEAYKIIKWSGASA